MVTRSTTETLRVVFFGTPAFAVPTLEALLGSRHTVTGVVTQPDRPSGRGQRISSPPVKALALTAGLPVLQPPTLKDAALLEHLASMKADFGIVAAYGKILTTAVLAVTERGFLNVHASLLPRYRGAAPVHRAIIAGEPQTGVTIMRVVQALDAGPMLARESRPIGPDETSVAVEHDLARLGAALLIRTLDALAIGEVPEMAQDDRDATYARKLTKDDGIVDWRWSAERIHDLVRGLHPWPHAFTFLDGRRFILRSARRTAGSASAEPGTVLEASGGRLTVATGTGVLEILEIQSEGTRSMTAREFLAGHPLSAGERFRSP
ncbi:MAG TPA: methionyl-tRNA formyltransferase [Vicinamibacterales bacterium]|nr:methionyl-tRNA formyltransferase [Vicinamibacterales bacterium]